MKYNDQGILKCDYCDNNAVIAIVGTIIACKEHDTYTPTLEFHPGNYNECYQCTGYRPISSPKLTGAV